MASCFGFQRRRRDIKVARRLIVPEGLMKVARLRKAYVATAEDGFANPWLSGAP